MIRFVALVQTDSAVVEQESCISGKNRPLLQAVKYRRMQGRGTLDSFKGGREAGSFSENPGAVENRIHRRHGGVTCSDDPAGLGILKYSASRRDCLQDVHGIGRTIMVISFNYDHRRKNPFPMQRVDSADGIQITSNNEQNRETLHRSPFMPLRKMNTGTSLSRAVVEPKKFCHLLHSQAVPSFHRPSNPI